MDDRRLSVCGLTTVAAKVDLTFDLRLWDGGGLG